MASKIPKAVLNALERVFDCEINGLIATLKGAAKSLLLLSRRHQLDVSNQFHIEVFLNQIAGK